MSDEEARGRRVRVRYEQTAVAFASQFIVNASAEEVIVNFSAGYLPEGAGGELTLPVQTRVALTLAGAQRLVETLQRALAERDDGGVATGPLAELPRLD